MGSNPRDHARAFTRVRASRVFVNFFLYFLGGKPFSTGPYYRPVLNFHFSTGRFDRY